MSAAALAEWRHRWAVAIKSGRDDLGVSQHQLAHRLSCAQSTLAAWESATYVPVDVMKPRVVAVLGLDPMALLAPLEADPPAIGLADNYWSS